MKPRRRGTSATALPRRYCSEVIGSKGVRLGEEAARRLVQTGQCEIGPGLTGTEFARIERDYDVEFAEDHRAFLAAGLPLNPRSRGARPGRGWPDWRHGRRSDLRKMLDWPIEGALFDVKYNDRWHPSWGQRPARRSTALRTARRHLAQAPKMIPVYEHRYLPAGRGTYGHPVLSIYQTDIIVYGTDLAEYILSESQGWFISPNWTPPPMVPFWSDFLTGELGRS